MTRKSNEEAAHRRRRILPAICDAAENQSAEVTLCIVAASRPRLTSGYRLRLLTYRRYHRRLGAYVGGKIAALKQKRCVAGAIDGAK